MPRQWGQRRESGKRAWTGAKTGSRVSAAHLQQPSYQPAPCSLPHTHTSRPLLFAWSSDCSKPRPTPQHSHNPDPKRWEHRLAHAETRTLKDTQRHATLCPSPTPPEAHKHSCEMCVPTSLQKLHTHTHTGTHARTLGYLDDSPADGYGTHLNTNSFLPPCPPPTGELAGSVPLSQLQVLHIHSHLPILNTSSLASSLHT